MVVSVITVTIQIAKYSPLFRNVLSILCVFHIQCTLFIYNKIKIVKPETKSEVI